MLLSECIVLYLLTLTLSFFSQTLCFVFFFQLKKVSYTVENQNETNLTEAPHAAAPEEEGRKVDVYFR